VKHIAQGHSLAVVHSLDKLLTRVRERKNVTIIPQSADRISHQNDTWTIHCRMEAIPATHLIYADQETVFKGVLDGNPKLP
jgi:hypothetical protein